MILMSPVYPTYLKVGPSEKLQDYTRQRESLLACAR
jgi:hypothetical protein